MTLEELLESASSPNIGNVKLTAMATIISELVKKQIDNEHNGTLNTWVQAMSRADADVGTIKATTHSPMGTIRRTETE